MVPPVLAGVLVWGMALLDVIPGAHPQVPAGARALFTLGAPVALTALACWEMHRPRRLHGLTIRAAPGR
ncbi:hypothetical protein OG444_36730 [Streptomyces sp. NBC_01232]|uniref:hypothetical protein n=1 Tax=Streptomyces sp. NBC_01232 TaxID=2903786 RepID=UPI002E0D6DA8|nr:hypothetical protein OG444_36730 [Streptomyces sp. NBC_01232]